MPTSISLYIPLELTPVTQDDGFDAKSDVIFMQIGQIPGVWTPWFLPKEHHRAFHNESARSTYQLSLSSHWKTHDVISSDFEPSEFDSFGRALPLIPPIATPTILAPVLHYLLTADYQAEGQLGVFSHRHREFPTHFLRGQRRGGHMGHEKLFAATDHRGAQSMRGCTPRRAPTYSANLAHILASCWSS